MYCPGEGHRFPDTDCRDDILGLNSPPTHGGQCLLQWNVETHGQGGILGNPCSAHDMLPMALSLARSNGLDMGHFRSSACLAALGSGTKLLSTTTPGMEQKSCSETQLLYFYFFWKLVLLWQAMRTAVFVTDPFNPWGRPLVCQPETAGEMLSTHPPIAGEEDGVTFDVTVDDTLVVQVGQSSQDRQADSRYLLLIHPETAEWKNILSIKEESRKGELEWRSPGSCSQQYMNYFCQEREMMGEE